MKKILIAAIISAALLAALTACKKEEDKKPYNGVPDKVISRSSQSEQSVSPPEVSTPITDVADENGVTENTVPSEDTVGDISQADTSAFTKASEEKTSAKTDGDKPADSQPVQSSSQETDETDEDVSVSEESGLAFEYMELLNSKQVHAILIEAETMDGEEIFSVSREYFVDGENAVYINDSQKIIYTSDTVTVIDLEEKTYYSYPREDDEDSDSIFGYSPSEYVQESTETAEDGTVTEVYIITQHRSTVRSTWTFSPGGRFTVRDESIEYGSFKWYDFLLISRDISAIDYSIPDDLTLTEPEDIQ